MENATFNKKNIPFTSKLDLNVWKKPLNCYIWSIKLNDAEPWAL
jgi:hypothetical protein